MGPLSGRRSALSECNSLVNIIIVIIVIINTILGNWYIHDYRPYWDCTVYGEEKAIFEKLRPSYGCRTGPPPFIGKVF